MSSLLRLGMYALLVLGVVGSLYAGYRVWRHSIWVEGRDAALVAVARQNQRAAEAATRVRTSTDRCFDEGGSWDVVTGTCQLGGTTPAGVSRLFTD